MHTRASAESGSPGRETFPRGFRISARRDFREAYDTGAKLHGRLVVVFARPRPEGELRLGITATRKSGGAVLRNRARRRVREIFRKWRGLSPRASADVVVNVSARAARAPFAALETEVVGLLGRAADVAAKSGAAAARTK